MNSPASEPIRPGSQQSDLGGLVLPTADGSSLLAEEDADLLRAIGQPQLIDHLNALKEPHLRNELIQRLRQFDPVSWGNLSQTPDLSHVSSAPVFRMAYRDLRQDVVDEGVAAYRERAVAVIIVAGGQGTRLGFDGPKGLYPFSPLLGKSIYQLQLEKVINACEWYSAELPLLIMTSPATHSGTEVYLRDNAFFGLPAGQVKVFSQGTVPSTDLEGRFLLAGPGKLAENPDGHGGCLEALKRSGALEWVRKQGVTDLVYIQVDNVLAPVDDPFAVGLRRRSEVDRVSKVLQKTDPLEKVGALVEVQGRPTIVEYSDLSPEMARQKTAGGERLFGWGSPSMYFISTQFLAGLQQKNFVLPFHLARKNIEAWNGSEVQPVPGIKRERFFFDIVPESRHLGLEVNRAHEFAPIKNMTGIDSVESARRIISDEHCRWLREAGVDVQLPPGKFIEISPRFAVSLPQFVKRWGEQGLRTTRVTDNLVIER